MNTQSNSNIENDEWSDDDLLDLQNEFELCSYPFYM